MTSPLRHRTALTALLSAAALATIGAVGTSAASASAPTGRTVTGAGATGTVNVRTGAGVTLADVHAHPALQREHAGYGSAVLAAHRLTTPTDTVAVRADATHPARTSVQVQVRGRTGAGAWTTWAEVGAAGTATVERPVDTVQAQVILTADGARSATVRSVTFAPRAARVTARPAAVGTPLTSRVFATREGLVGGTTSNGHVITNYDHFVALPSTAALNPRGAYTYQVQVCNGTTCLTEPVWDVGPWNTHDDYWASPRTGHPDLARGLPEAQAAYVNGYNGGHDEFGRSVANPAGIDLADGVFGDLGMRDNGYVTVTYLWTNGGGAPTGPNVVTDGGFEDSGTGPWQCTASCGVDHGANLQHSGTSNGWARNNTGWTDIHQTVTVTPNKTYRLSGWLRTSTNSDNGFFGVRTTPSNVDATVLGEAHFTRLNGYQQVSVDVAVGASTFVTVYGGVWTDHGDIFLQLDDISLAAL